MAPTILFVPGFWEGPTVFDAVATLLQQSNVPGLNGGFSTETASLASTGTTSPGNPTMRDDVLAIRACLTRLVEAEKEVLLVAHSAGGFLSSEAMEDMALKIRKERGLSGGVVGIVFLTAGVMPEGYQHGDLPFFEIKDNAMYCRDTRQTLLSDLNDAEAEKWIPLLKSQPAEGWNGTITYCGWRYVPSTYLICEGDQLLPVPLQEQFASSAGAKVERCSAGHMCMLTAKEKVAEVIREALK